jgi:hypothetical protein
VKFFEKDHKEEGNNQANRENNGREARKEGMRCDCRYFTEKTRRKRRSQKKQEEWADVE